mmetsp:Transcript_30947/g.40864  ORF Transcript_30947/g.40864 Transcript_30947/m.40864 type:complete len:710 (+) Transcript_30947:141-2270(+)
MDLNSIEQGSIDVVSGIGLLIILGYILLGISVLCEEYFVSSLNVIVEVYDFPPEVAGATLMAAGTSSPELFAAIVGIFFSAKSDTGISTVVGSVVFNTLMIIGVSIMVSPSGVIKLDPAPLMREVVFYSAALGLLFMALGDGVVDLWEASILVSVYLLYVMWACWGNDMVIYVWKIMKIKQKGMDFGKLVKVDRDDSETSSLLASEDGEMNPQLKAEVNELLTVFIQSCVILAFYQMVPEEVANHPGVLDYILAWVQSGQLTPPSDYVLPSEIPQQMEWLMKYSSGNVEEVDKGRILTEAVELVKTESVSREELGQLLVLKLNASKMDSTEILKLLPLPDRSMIPMSEIFHMVTNDLESGADFDADMEAPVLSPEALRVQRMQRLQRLEAMPDGIERAMDTHQGFLDEEEKYAAMMHLKDERIISNRDRKIISVVSVRYASGENLTKPLLFPLAQVVASVFLWTRFRSKFFTLYPAEMAIEDSLAGSMGSGLKREASSRRFVADDIVQHIVHPMSPWEMPKPTYERILWTLTLPFQVLYFITVPDCRKPRLKKYYFATLFLSMAWLSILTFAMIRLAESIGEFWMINPALLGFTLLAAGTSFPDFFSSIVVAKYGDGDMAVSNALGSNNFDILFGLGLPYVVKCLITGEAQPVSTIGVTSSVFILVGLLIVFMIANLIGKFVLTKHMGIAFCCLYAVYIIFCMINFLKV